jgi:cytochrome c553
MSLHNRLKKLEDASRRSSRTVSAKALKALSDEDLDALEETFETALASGEGSFEDFYAVVTERGRRALEAHCEAIEAWQSGERDRASVRRGGPPAS